jgi:tRNA G10  N-methylase Trm11
MDWDFKLHDTQYLTHGFHSYPAKMIPQIAGKLIAEFGKNATVLFDPFCGTGTSLVEAKIRNINGIGFDLNPLALLIAEAKTTRIEKTILSKNLHAFNKFDFSFINASIEKSNFIPKISSNIDYWFSRKVQKELGLIKYYIETQINNEDVKRFFEVAFSLTIRECSWTRNDEFKLYRMPEEKIKLFNPDVFSFFQNILNRNFLKLIDFNNLISNDKQTKLYKINSCNYISQKVLKDNSVDIVVTSPPYGDSQTTVAYGQFSAFANQWINGLEYPRHLDKELLGGIKAKKLTNVGSDVLYSQILEISRIDKSRALDVVGFYRDYKKSIANISLKVKKKGYACFVVSNRTVKGVNLRTDLITIDFFKQNGFKHIETFERQILNKRLPRKNSPNGQNGNKKNLMNTEYVIIMQKKCYGIQ